MKNLTFIYSLLVFCYSLLLSSCVTLYKPNMIQSPMLTAKGDIEGELAYNPFSGCGDFQAAYALSQKISIASAVLYDFKHNRNISYYNFQHQEMFGELAAGYTGRIDGAEEYLFQFFGGAGTGKTNDYYSFPSEGHVGVKGDYNKYFLQAGLVYTEEPYDLSFDFRASYIEVFNIKSRNIYFDTKPRHNLIYEPAITFRCGFKNIKLFAQGGLNIPDMHSKVYEDINNSLCNYFHFDTGINFTINTARNRTKK